MAQVGQKNILILGGSYGGVSTAHYLLKHAIPGLPAKDGYKVLLVSVASQAMCRPACPRALISDEMFAQDKLFVNIVEQFKQYPAENFRFIQGAATKLDHANRTVSIHLADGGNEQVNFYAIVIATGASTPSPLLGLNQDEEFLRAKWAEFRKALPNAKRIVIAGGGPAGVETAGELGEYLNGRPGWFSSRLVNPKVNITLVTSGSRVLPALRPSLAKAAEEYLAKVGVTVMKNAKVVSAEPASYSTDSQGSIVGVATPAVVTLHGPQCDGTTLNADLYIPAIGTTPNTRFVSESLLSADGRVETNTSTLRVDQAGPRIYAVGDCASYSRPAIHIMLEAIPVLGRNIKRDLILASGATDIEAPAEKVFKEDTRETQMVPIGRSVGVGAAMGYALPSFMVWLIKGRDYWLWTTGGLWSGKQWNKE